MAIVKAKPTSPGRRGLVRVRHDHLWKGKPYESLTEAKKSSGGRNNNGRITTRHQGGGHKQRYRVIDFKRDKDGIRGTVERIEYDPNRSAHIALIKYADGERRYILAPRDLFAGDQVMSGSESAIKPGKGGQLARSAGASVQLVAREGRYATLLLRSGEMRKIHVHSRATIGQVSNSEHNLEKLGKAGAKRWRGVRPTVRGVVMNPVDHPHGGGEGKTSGGRHPVTPWGVQTKGKRTRTNKRTSKFIVRTRKRK
jgi:large subunit ribosomal protein L2